MGRYVVAQADEIRPGDRRLVTVAGRTVGIFNVHGCYYALKNLCVHAQAPVCLGQVTGMFESSAPGRYGWSREEQILRCPWHGWEFDITTGESVFDPQTKLVTYRVRVENG